MLMPQNNPNIINYSNKNHTNLDRVENVEVFPSLLKSEYHQVLVSATLEFLKLPMSQYGNCKSLVKFKTSTY